jgi:hypothetical protein
VPTTRKQITNLEKLLDRIGEADDTRGRVSMSAIMDAIGRRSFGPLILFAGLVALSPVGDIPGTPTIIGVFVLLIAVQLLFRRDYFWLPRWLLERSVSVKRLRKSLDWLRRPARWVDRFLRPRLSFFSTPAGVVVIAVLCCIIGLALPVMDFVPFTGSAAGLALTGLGLSLIAHDGVFAVVAIVATLSGIGAVVYKLL